jgi:sensor c-di-GMP phosphodiesterase-like protein
MSVTDLNEIRRAFEAREFFLVYLPTISLPDGRCAGAEALIRWRRADQSVIDAREFIPATDRTPLAGVITYWVIDTVAVEIGAWLVANPDAHISINVPPEILGRGGLQYAAVKSGLSSRIRQVIIEVTERGIPDQLGLDALNSVAGTGARVALDDVMLTGANLALLTRCHVDIVKIDRTLVEQLRPGEPQPDWLTGLKPLIESTSLHVVGEGVETAYQAEALKAAGVQMAQGHHFSPPLSAADYKRYYKETRGKQA